MAGGLGYGLRVLGFFFDQLTKLVANPINYCLLNLDIFQYVLFNNLLLYILTMRLFFIDQGYSLCQLLYLIATAGKTAETFKFH